MEAEGLGRYQGHVVHAEEQKFAFLKTPFMLMLEKNFVLNADAVNAEAKARCRRSGQFCNGIENRRKK